MKVKENVYEPLSKGVSEAKPHIGKRLQGVREFVGLTQLELATRLNIGQAGLARLESRRDILVSTLREYLGAMGATLRVDARFADASALVTSLREADFQFEQVNENQLVLPIFGDDLYPPHRDVVFSIKPEYCSKIIEGRKTVELRRRFPMSVPPGTTALIYATSPTRALLGIAEIGEVHRRSPNEIWETFADRACIAREDFDSYFAGVDRGFVIELRRARSLRRPLQLSELRSRFSFEPPQSFLYATQQMREALHYECSEMPY